MRAIRHYTLPLHHGAVALSVLSGAEFLSVDAAFTGGSLTLACIVDTERESREALLLYVALEGREVPVGCNERSLLARVAVRTESGWTVVHVFRLNQKRRLVLADGV